MPLGQGALGLSVCYALAIGYLVLMWLIGKVLTRQYPTSIRSNGTRAPSPG